MVNFDRYVNAFSTRVKSVAATTSPKIKGLASASPKARAIAAGGALAVVTGVAAPIALTQSGHDTSPDVAMATAEHASPQSSGAQSSDTQSPGTQSPGAQSPAKAATEAPSNADGMAPADNQLHTVGIQGSQSDVALGADQIKNAEKIVAAGKAMGLPPRAWVIALATSMQESKLHNLGHLGSSNDHDSLGLFQQRPTSGWGTPDQLQDPTLCVEGVLQVVDPGEGLGQDAAD